MRRAWPLVVVLLAGCATLRALLREERPPFIPEEAAHISGAYSRAVGVAYEDWMADRARQKLERDAYEDAGNAVAPENHRVSECYDRADAYQTWIWSNDAGTSYFVNILYLEGSCFPKEEGPPYYGDFMTYEIDARTFQILKREVDER